MQANYVQRLRLTFSKMGPAQFIGHLDLTRTLERSFNRARLPIAYTQGFNRRPRMSLAAALPLGFTSEFELADIWMAEKVEPAGVQDKIMQSMAPGIELSQVVEVPLSAPSLQSLVTSATYEAFLSPEAISPADLHERIETILAAQNLPQQRKRGRDTAKEFDLRPLIIDLSAAISDEKQARISMELFLSPTKTGRPDDVLAALSLDPLDARIHRKRISLFQSPAD